MILRTIHVGVNGTGKALLEAMAADPQFKPVAIVESSAPSAKTAQYLLGLAGHANVPIFSGLTGALSQIEANALVISAPVKNHAEFCRMAFAVGAHVLMERPIATDFQEALTLGAEAQAAWSRFCIVQPQRYSAAQQTMKFLLETPGHPHSPGQVQLVDVICQGHHKEPAGGDYACSAIFEQTIDHADSLLALLQTKVKRVTARSYAAPWTHFIHESNVWALLEYENGTLVNYLLSGDAMTPMSRFVLHGERGALVLTDGVDLRFHAKPGEGNPPPAEGEPVEMLDCPAPEQTMANEFFRYVVEEVEPGNSARRNLRALAVCEMMVRSIKSKRPVERTELGVG